MGVWTALLSLHQQTRMRHGHHCGLLCHRGGLRFSVSSPELVLLTRATEDLGLGMAPGMDLLAGALQEELAVISTVPVVEVSRAQH